MEGIYRPYLDLAQPALDALTAAPELSTFIADEIKSKGEIPLDYALYKRIDETLNPQPKITMAPKAMSKTRRTKTKDSSPREGQKKSQEPSPPKVVRVNITLEALFGLCGRLSTREDLIRSLLLETDERERDRADKLRAAQEKLEKRRKEREQRIALRKEKKRNKKRARTRKGGGKDGELSGGEEEEDDEAASSSAEEEMGDFEPPCYITKESWRDVLGSSPKNVAGKSERRLRTGYRRFFLDANVRGSSLFFIENNDELTKNDSSD